MVCIRLDISETAPIRRARRYLAVRSPPSSNQSAVDFVAGFSCQYELGVTQDGAIFKEGSCTCVNDHTSSCLVRSPAWLRDVHPPHSRLPARCSFGNPRPKSAFVNHHHLCGTVSPTPSSPFLVNFERLATYSSRRRAREMV
jgi:hypothetical protein